MTNVRRRAVVLVAAAGLLSAGLAAAASASATTPASATTTPCANATGRLYNTCAVTAAIGIAGASGGLAVTSATGNDGTWGPSSTGAYTSASGEPITWVVGGTTRHLFVGSSINTTKRTGFSGGAFSYFHDISGKNYKLTTVSFDTDYNVTATGSSTVRPSEHVYNANCTQKGSTKDVGKDCVPASDVYWAPDVEEKSTVAVSGTKYSFTLRMAQDFDRWVQNPDGSMTIVGGTHRSGTFTFSGNVTSTTVTGTTKWSIVGGPSGGMTISSTKQATTFTGSGEAA